MTALSERSTAANYVSILRCRPVVTGSDEIDHGDMNFIDRAPGGAIVVANIILYTTVLAEIGMLTTGSVAVMGAVMALIAILAVGLCMFIMDLMGSEAYAYGESETQVAVAVTRPETVVAPAPARRRPTSRPRVAALS
jgi:hypothetical protein